MMTRIKMTSEQIETARKLVAAGFQYTREQRFVFVRTYTTSTHEAGTISGGGQALKVTYGPAILPDLNDEATAAAVRAFQTDN
jgi:hypothetical protein